MPFIAERSTSVPLKLVNAKSETSASIFWGGVTGAPDAQKGKVKSKKDKSPEEREKFITKFTKLHKAPQDEFDAFIKDLGKEGYDKNEIKKIIKKRKEYQAKKASDSAKKEKEKAKKTPEKKKK